MVSSSSDQEDDDNDKQEDSRVEDEATTTMPTTTGIYSLVMHSHARELVFIVALVFTAIAALQNGPLKTRKVKPPELFFTPPSLVTDFYQGNYKNLVTLLSEKDVTLVMYYAPWDATCMHVREEVEIAARYYHNEVYFAAINCWWPEGECSKRFTIPSYPVIVAHIHEVGGVRYDGPIIAPYIISFLDFILSPLTPLQHTGELLDLLTKHEGVLVAYFEFKDNSYPAGYESFYVMSLKALTTDPNRSLCFAVITNKKVAMKFKMQSSIQLYLWNSTEIFHEPSGGKVDLLDWAYSKLRQVSRWVTPPGVKSTALSEIIEQSPVLILFTPRNMLMESSPYYDLVREVAADYYNCNKTTPVSSLIHRIILKRHILQEEFSKQIEKCFRNTTEYHPDVCLRNPELCDLTCCKILNIDLNANVPCQCRACLHHVVGSVSEMKVLECERTLELVLKSFHLNDLNIYDNCHNIEVTYPIKFGPYKRLSFNCHDKTSHFSPVDVGKSKQDDFVLHDDHILMMIQSNEKRQCHRLKYALNYSELNFPDFPVSETTAWQEDGFAGLGCRTNKTLVFIAMDVVLFHDFAENLGVEVLKNYHQTVAVIVEAAQERQFVLKDHINKRTLGEFIKNYTGGGLDRHLRMPIRKIIKCHEDRGPGSVCVQEVTTATFSDIVLDNKKDVVLLYYASWCGACSSVAHIFLSVADYFAHVREIKFVRISGEDNELPWEYTVGKYPTIIMFPAKRKSDSIPFPSNALITATNLLHFVLIHAQPVVRLVFSMEMCNKECIARNLAQSSRELRLLFWEHRMLLNNIHFIRHKISLARPKRKKTTTAQRPKIQTNFPKIPSFDLSNYLEHLINRIRANRRKTKKTLKLQSVLRKKRNVYAGDAASEKDEEAKDSGKKYNTGAFSKVHNKKAKAKKDEL